MNLNKIRLNSLRNCTPFSFLTTGRKLLYLQKGC